MSVSPSLLPRADFSGLWIPLVTPFLNGQVDHGALKRLVLHYQACGIAGLVVCGTTGEAAALDDDEQLAVLATVKSAAPGLPLVMGLTGYHLGHTLARVRAFNNLGLAAILLPAPHYIRPSQAGLLDWFTRLADASAVPVIVYDIPYRTGATLTLPTLLALAAHPKIKAVKDCGGDAAKTRALIADGRLQVLCGEDALMFNTLADGGHGAIAAAAHAQTVGFVQLIDKIKVGDLAAARSLWDGLLPLVNALFSEPNPGPLKALLAQQGFIADELRSPMTRATPELGERLRQLDAALR